MSTPASGAEASLTAGELGERGLVERIRSRFAALPGVLTVGIGDDAAVAPAVRGALEVLTTDALVEGVHFDLAWSSFADVGYKALAVNVSDIAAMGAAPRLALLSLILPDSLAVADLDALLGGFAEMAAEARVTLAGGNLTRSPAAAGSSPDGSSRGPLVVDVTAVGSVRPRKILTRAGGRPGDVLYLTGTIGAAAAGLGWLRAQGRSGREPEDEALRECVARHRRPAPRLRIGALAGQNRAASACMDLSDGLADAVRQVAEQSGTGARIDGAALPIHPGAALWFSSQGQDPALAAIAGGDDYELLLAVPAKHRGRFRSVVQQARGVPLTRIGELTKDRDLVVVRGDRREPLPAGFLHF